MQLASSPRNQLYLVQEAVGFRRPLVVLGQTQHSGQIPLQDDSQTVFLRLEGDLVNQASNPFPCDRVQFTAPDRQRHIANRELATIEQVTAGGRLSLHLDSGRTLALTLKDYPHLDHGYAVTSYSSQGQTADRVLAHVDTEHAPEQLVNRRLAYVALSRGRFDAQIFADDKSRLMEALSRDVSQHAALDAGRGQNAPARQVEHVQALMRGFGLGL
jgi:hypothetical protein